MQTNKVKFSFKDLEVWKKAIDFADKLIDISEPIQAGHKNFRLIEQLESASTLIAMNILEGKDRYSKKEFVQFLYIALGSLYETVTLLMTFHKRKWIIDKKIEEIKNIAEHIGKILSGPINSIKNS